MFRRNSHVYFGPIELASIIFSQSKWSKEKYYDSPVRLFFWKKSCPAIIRYSKGPAILTGKPILVKPINQIFVSSLRYVIKG